MTVGEIYNNGIVNLSLMYASEYEKNPKNFIRCFLKFKGIRSVCEQIVNVYKKIGAFDSNGKDFSEWVNKQPLEEKCKKVLTEMLLIIYSIINYEQSK